MAQKLAACDGFFLTTFITSFSSIKSGVIKSSGPNKFI
jgi:hypothetical protein